MGKIAYNDGLDDDGNPLLEWEGRIPYVRGSEAHVGEFNPIAIGTAGIDAVERIIASIRTAPTADSPIETILGAAILLAFERASRPLVFSRITYDIGPLLLIPQFQWSAKYRSDFAIYNPRTTGALLIECDGRDFHSSPEQIAYDKKRDAAAHDRGHLVMRFPGYRIHADADGCAREVFAIVYGGAR